MAFEVLGCNLPIPNKEIPRCVIAGLGIPFMLKGNGRILQKSDFKE
ncbi:hypothetical protein [Croceitalea sp. MTPC5]